jgi:hypothetical protein
VTKKFLTEIPLAVAPESSIVSGKEGPLKKGELERAGVWAKEIVKSLSLAKP